MQRFLSSAIALLIASAAWAASAFEPVTLVVPTAAGSGTDRTARDLAQAFRTSPRHGAAVLVENVGGAAGTLAATRVARAAPDGRTLLLANSGMSSASALNRELPFNALDDFAFVGMIDEQPLTLIGRPTLPAETFADLLQWLDTESGHATLAYTGSGSSSQLCALVLQRATRAKLRLVGYRGIAPAMSDLIGGQVDLLCDASPDTMAWIEQGKVRAYAVTGRRRVQSPALPTLSAVPTFDELGPNGFDDIMVWHALYAPAGTPAAVLDTLGAALQEALQSPEFVRRESQIGARIAPPSQRTAELHRRFVAHEIARWQDVLGDTPRTNH